ncbi:DNA-binding response regulator [Xylanibacillus composti]|nr:DNA-binding response regulator [Xylanibacillus composti]MDT9724740.1 DNA-binding response regulator [Xylanibacillus composti]
MAFREAYEQFISDHLQKRKGEAARRLREGHGHAEQLFLENVWWPAFGHFHHLYPEFEVTDFKDGFRFIDFAYVRSGLMLAIELDGFGPHWRNISRWQFVDHNRRQNDLIIDGWKVLRFAYDDIKEYPRFCQQKLQQFVGRWYGEGHQALNADWREKEIIRYALKAGRPLKPLDLSDYMGVDVKTARKWLAQLVEKGWLLPASGEKRIRAYRLNVEGKHFTL